jgi:UrcA family protein
MNTINIKPVALGGALIWAALSFAVPAHADIQNEDTVPQMRLVTTGFDLTTTEGIKALRMQARRQAADMCQYDSHEVQVVGANLNCFNTAMKNANTQIDALAAQSRSKIEPSTSVAQSPQQSAVKTSH